MHIKPMPGLTIPMPEAHGRPLPPEGAVVTNTEYWRRRLADGDVVPVPPAPVLTASVTPDTAKGHRK